MPLDLSGGVKADDIEIQTINAEVSWDTNELAGGMDASLTPISSSVAEVAEGLERDELAELKHVEGTAAAVLLGATETVDTAARVNVTLSSDADRATTPGGETSGGATIEYGSALEVDHIAAIEIAAGGGFEDSASGVGGSATPGHVSMDVPYALMFDQGPTYDRHDDLYIHGTGTNFDAQDAELHVYTTWALYWQIHDRDF